VNRDNKSSQVKCVVVGHKLLASVVTALLQLGLRRPADAHDGPTANVWDAPAQAAQRLLAELSLVGRL
jgi:hypothetical protein